jgi:hypothetical protein
VYAICCSMDCEDGTRRQTRHSALTAGGFGRVATF